VRLRIPDHVLAEAKGQWRREKVVVVIWSAIEQSGKRGPVAYYAPIEDGYFEVSLPAGDYFCHIGQEVARETAREITSKLLLPFGLCHVRPTGATLGQEPSRYGKILGSLLGQETAGLQYVLTAEPLEPSPTALSTLG
jgi:hypothetical protein